jgi:thiosulfate dehydrogenase
MQWLGKNVPKGKSPAGSGIKKITFIDRPADTLKGRMVFESNCVTCHRENGQGVLNADSTEYVYPPLWGDHSYTMGAGLFRVSTFAGYAYCNMPFGKASAAAPVLTNEQAWDVAAYINAKPRPSYDVKKDWPVLSTKPVDYPFGPYADTFTEQQHKFGPFAPIAAWQDSVKKITATAKAKL